MPADATEQRLQQIALETFRKPKERAAPPRVNAKQEPAPGAGVIAFQAWIDDRFGGGHCALWIADVCTGVEHAEAYQGRRTHWRVRYSCSGCSTKRVKTVGPEDAGDVEQAWERFVHGLARARGMGWVLSLAEWHELGASQQFVRMYLTPDMVATLADPDDDDEALWSMDEATWATFSVATGTEREEIWADWRATKLF